MLLQDFAGLFWFVVLLFWCRRVCMILQDFAANMRVYTSQVFVIDHRTNVKLSTCKQENITLFMRSAIERTFGVWKARWGFIHNMPRYDFGKVQVPLVGASMAIHNFIRRNSSDDEAFNKVANAETFTFNDIPNVDGLGDDDDGEPEGDDDVHMNDVRKSIRNELVRHRRELGL
ncbi:hypothetical protein CsSME_00037269 [Camellia sinensis var. sinensis]